MDIKLKMGRAGKEGVTTLCFLTQPQWLLFWSAHNYSIHTPEVQHVWDLGFQVQDPDLSLTHHSGFANQPLLLEALEPAERQAHTKPPLAASNSAQWITPIVTSLGGHQEEA